MRKILLVATAIVLIFASCKEKAPEDKTILEDFTPFYRMPVVLKGKVKTYKVRTYWAVEKDGKIEKGDIITRTERDSINYMSDFNLEFNENGLPTRREFISYDGKINHSEIDIEDNKIVGGRVFNDGEQISYFKEEYDDSGRRIKELSYRYGPDTLRYSCEVKYLDNGLKDEWIYSNEKGERTYKHKFIWKDAGVMAEHIIYKPDGSLSYKMKLDYDDAGNWKSASFEYPDEETHYFEIKDLKLDHKGNMVSNVAYFNGELYTVTDYLIEYYPE